MTSTTSHLTDAEVKILRWVASGLTNARIGQRLGIKRDAATHRLTTIFRKLGAKDRANAVYLACQSGILPIGRTS